MNTELISQEKQEQIEKELQELLTTGKIELIETEEQYQNAEIAAQAFTKFVKEKDELRKELKAPHLANGKKIDDFFNPVINKVKEARLNLDKCTLDFEDKKERERIEQQRLADEQARKEREKHESKSEKLNEQAEQALQDGNNGLAEKLQLQAEAAEDKADTVVSNIVAPAVEKTKGSFAKVTFAFELRDAKTFAEWCIKTENTELIAINDKAFKAFLKMKQGKVEIPGVRITQNKSKVRRTQ